MRPGPPYLAGAVRRASAGASGGTPAEPRSRWRTDGGGPAPRAGPGRRREPGGDPRTGGRPQAEHEEQVAGPDLRPVGGCPPDRPNRVSSGGTRPQRRAGRTGGAPGRSVSRTRRCPGSLCRAVLSALRLPLTPARSRLTAGPASAGRSLAPRPGVGHSRRATGSVVRSPCGDEDDHGFRTRTDGPGERARQRFRPHGGSRDCSQGPTDGAPAGAPRTSRTTNRARPAPGAAGLRARARLRSFWGRRAAAVARLSAGRGRRMPTCRSVCRPRRRGPARP